MRILHVKVDSNLPSDIKETVRSGVQEMFNGKNVKSMITQDDDVEISFLDTNVLSEIKSELEEIKELLKYPPIVVNDNPNRKDDFPPDFSKELQRQLKELEKLDEGEVPVDPLPRQPFKENDMMYFHNEVTSDGGE
jgi:hypothetical protein